MIPDQKTWQRKRLNLIVQRRNDSDVHYDSAYDLSLTAVHKKTVLDYSNFSHIVNMCS